MRDQKPRVSELKEVMPELVSGHTQRPAKALVAPIKQVVPSDLMGGNHGKKYSRENWRLAVVEPVVGVNKQVQVCSPDDENM